MATYVSLARLFAFAAETVNAAFAGRAARLLKAVLCATLCTSATAEVLDLTVEEAVWTTRVENRQPVGHVKERAPVRSLYFWTRLKGGSKALELLRQEGKLPIVHQWIHSTFVSKNDPQTLQTDQDKLTDKHDGRALMAGNIAHSAGLAASVNDLKAFRWRTWSHKESIWSGTWTVVVRYADGEPVLCDKKPCRWNIQVR